MTIDRQTCQQWDAEDRLAPLRDQFALPPDVVYLDGNSLGVLPKSTPGQVADVVSRQWGEGLIRSWNDAGWIDLPARVGDRLARLLGADGSEVSVADSTSVNLFKVLSVAVELQRRDAPERRVIVSERANFPTDLYIAEAVAAASGLTLRLVDHHEVPEALGPDVAVLMWTHVNYRSGRMVPMAAWNARAHAAGVLTVWDLAHSAGAVPVALKAESQHDSADFAVGCGYKYLNGGPGAPAFAWVHPRHLARLQAEGIRQPLAGWMGHAAPFAFEYSYRPADGVSRFASGTPSILALNALQAGVETVLSAEPFGGMAALREKSLRQTQLLIELVASRCEGLGLRCITPADGAERGSQASFGHADGYPVMAALIARGIIGDFRAGLPGLSGDDGLGILRFGCTPLYTRFVDVWDTVEALRDILVTESWRDPRFSRRAAVT